MVDIKSIVCTESTLLLTPYDNRLIGVIINLDSGKIGQLPLSFSTCDKIFFIGQILEIKWDNNRLYDSVKRTRLYYILKESAVHRNVVKTV